MAKAKQGEYIGGIWVPAKPIKTNNPKGHNKYTPKAELVGKREHPLKLLTKDELMKERARCYREKRYYQTFVLGYAQKLSFIDQLLGLQEDNSKAIEKAIKDFKKKEGALNE